MIEITTRDRSYTLVVHGHLLISGHPEFAPKPVLVQISGSN